MNNYRTQETIRQLREIEMGVALSWLERKLSAEAAASPALAAQRAEEIRQLKIDLVTEKSADFIYTKYDGHLGNATPDQVAEAIRSAHTAFLQAHDLDADVAQLCRLFIDQYKDADVSLVSVWEQALAYLESRLCV